MSSPPTTVWRICRSLALRTATPSSPHPMEDALADRRHLSRFVRQRGLFSAPTAPITASLWTTARRAAPAAGKPLMRICARHCRVCREHFRPTLRSFRRSTSTARAAGTSQRTPISSDAMTGCEFDEVFAQNYDIPIFSILLFTPTGRTVRHRDAIRRLPIRSAVRRSLPMERAL